MICYYNLFTDEKSVLENRRDGGGGYGCVLLRVLVWVFCLFWAFLFGFFVVVCLLAFSEKETSPLA